MYVHVYCILVCERTVDGFQTFVSIHQKQKVEI